MLFSVTNKVVPNGNYTFHNNKVSRTGIGNVFLHA